MGRRKTFIINGEALRHVQLTSHHCMIKRASIIAVDSIEDSKLEAGDLMPAIERGVISWESVTELGRISRGPRSGSHER